MCGGVLLPACCLAHRSLNNLSKDLQSRDPQSDAFRAIWAAGVGIEVVCIWLHLRGCCVSSDVVFGSLDSCLIVNGSFFLLWCSSVEC